MSSHNNQQQQEGVILRRISSNTSSSGHCSMFAEVAGGTAADCAVICCCFPCGILNLAFLALYTIPAGICKKMFTKKQRRNKQQHRQQNKLLRKEEAGTTAAMIKRPYRASVCGCEADRQVYPLTTTFKVDEEVKRLEMEMLDTFYNTGFWRSPSQRHYSC